MLCSYHAPFSDFRQHCADGSIGHVVENGFNEHFGYKASASEAESWAASLVAANQALGEGTIDAHVFLELQMPLSSARCDLMLVGKDYAGNSCALIVELKQWSHVSASAVRDTVSFMGRPKVHPSVQARSYVNYLKHYHGAFTGHPELIPHGCAFLHNIRLSKDIIVLTSSSTYGTIPKEFPVFTASSIKDFESFVRKTVGHGSIEDVERLILDAEIRPSVKLLDVVSAAVQGIEEWQLLDEQITAHNQVISLVEEARSGSPRRHLVAVRGGPGTGKSVLAIQLLGYAARHHWRVTHATGSKAFQTVLQARTESFADTFFRKVHNVRFRKDLPVEKMFATFRDVASAGAAGRTGLDLVIGDEGHRLWDFRRNVRTYEAESSTPMIEEMLLASPVTVIFLDDNQGVRANEIGAVNYFEGHARRLGINFVALDLNTQFRCSGSQSYLDWIDNRLGFDAHRSTAWLEHGGYDFKIATDPASLQLALKHLSENNNKCRIVSGFCWRWSSPRPDGSLPHDLQSSKFGGWTAPWIEKGDRYAKPLDSRYFHWATDDAHAGEVGSIYSVQGFEFDYVGVIFGDDLVIRDGVWHAKLDRNKDSLFKLDLNRRRQVGATVDEATQLRNIYRVLLTRGIKGTMAFFLDDETRHHFDELVGHRHI